MAKNKKNGVDVMDETVQYEYTADGSSQDKNPPYMAFTPYDVPTVGSYDDYFEEQKKKNMESVDEQATEYTEQNNQRAKSYNEQVDQSVAAQETVYRGGIVEAENDARQQYDENHINELIGRKNVERALANMGLTDSGLNRSQQTQLAVMRGNADAATRGTMAKRVQELTDAINQAYIDAETQKSAYRQGLDDEYNSWYRGATATAKQNAAETAASRVAADQEAAQSVMEMNNENFWKTSEYNRGLYEFEQKQSVDAYKAETDRINASTKATTAANDAYTKQLRDYKDDRNSYYKSLVDSGMSDADAWATAYTRYPLIAGEYGEKEKDAANKQNAYYANYHLALQNGYGGTDANIFATAGGGEAGLTAVKDNAAVNAAGLVENLDFTVSGKVALWDMKNSPGSTFYYTEKGDGELIAKKAKTQLEKTEKFKTMGKEEKRYAITFAIVKGIEQSFPNEPHANNIQRIASACNYYDGADYNLAVAYYDQAGKEKQEGVSRTEKKSAEGWSSLWGSLTNSGSKKK